MNALDELLTRGVANIIPNQEELTKLLKNKKLNIYLGIDPTAVHIHLGNAVPLRKLQTFVDLGHRVTFLIGDFTALVGDTSDKESERPILTSEEIESNFQTYKKQASKILDFSKVKLKYNSKWLSKLTAKQIIQLMQQFSAGDFYSRELIKKRLTERKHVGFHELFYPILQGYDSYYMDTDLQIGGTDQTFNMQAGRTLQKKLRNKESYIIATEFLTGTDGRKMSKTWDNAVWLDDPASEIYGKVMSIKDELIIEYFTLATNLSLEKIAHLTAENQTLKTNPMEAKKLLAHQITTELHDKKSADIAQTDFEQIYQQQKTPTNMPEFTTSQTEWNLLKLLSETKLTDSKSVARRLIEQKGFKLNQQKITDSIKHVKIKSGDILQAGRHKFIKIKIKSN